MFGEMTYTTFVNRYRDKSYIGSGGFSKVYKVHDFAKNHYVALKIADVRPELNKFTLQNEVTLVNQLPPHQNVVRYDACYRFNTGITGEMDFAVLPFYEHGNLEQFLKKEKLSPKETNWLIAGLLKGVDFLHKNNCIHRDLKPENILIHRENGMWVAKISDFGLSRYVNEGDLSISNSSIGISFLYAAPEQIKNQKIQKNVDIWAIGVIIYRIITGQVLFKGSDNTDSVDPQSQLETSRKIINLELPENINTIEEPYQSIIKKCLVIDPAQRAQSAAELLALMDAPSLIENTPTPIIPVTYPQTPVDVPEVPVEMSAPPVPPVASSFEDDGKTEIMMDKTEVITPKPEIPKQPKEEYRYTPPKFFPIPEYENPKENVTQVFAHVAKDASPPPPKEPEVRIKTNDTSEGFNKLWIYLPLFFIVLAGSVYGLYIWLNNSPAPPSTPSGPPKVIKQTPPPPKAVAIPPDFIKCFNDSRKALGGTFQLIPTDEFHKTFEGLDKNCYDNICKELRSIRRGAKPSKEFYNKARAGNQCYAPVLNRSLAYHKQQLKDLPLLAMFYDSGQSKLSVAQKNKLDAFLKNYKRNAKNYGLLIIGRASNIGNMESNKKLSEKRAKNITSFVDGHYVKDLKTRFVFFGADPPQLDKATADLLKIDQNDYKNISYGSGSDKDFGLRLNQSVLLVIYPKKEDAFGLEE